MASLYLYAVNLYFGAASLLKYTVHLNCTLLNTNLKKKNVSHVYQGLNSDLYVSDGPGVSCETAVRDVGPALT